MAQAPTTTSKQATQPNTATVPQQKPAQASFTDPDVLIVLFLAIVIDVLDVVLAIGVFVNLVLGVPFILWMIWKTGKLQSGKDQVQTIRQGPQQQEARRKAVRRVLRRGIFFFLGGLVPILSIFFVWTYAIIKTVRGK